MAVWGPWWVLCGAEGFALLDDHGETMSLRFDAQSWRPPLLLGNDALAVCQPGNIKWLDPYGELIECIHEPRHNEIAIAVGELLLTVVEEGHQVKAYRVVGDRVCLEWSLNLPAPVRQLLPLDSHHFVALSYPRAWLISTQGHLVCEVDEKVCQACVWGSAIAMTADGTQDLLVWLDGELVRIPHGDGPDTLAPLPTGVATADGNILRVFRSDIAPAPLLPVPDDGLPVQQTIVINGRLGRVTSRGPFASCAEHNGESFRVDNSDIQWRPLVDRETALGVVRRLLARDLPQLILADPVPQAAAATPQETLPLFGSHLVDPSRLTATQNMAARHGLDTFLAELAGAIGTTPLELERAVRQGVVTSPPRAIEDYRYIGHFDLEGGPLIAADPCYLSSREFVVNISTAAPGRWHAFIRNGRGSDSISQAELAVIHDTGFDTEASTELGTVAVDAGMAGVFTASCPEPDMNLVASGIHAEQAAMARSGWGDGFYPVLVGRRQRRVVKVRLLFLDDSTEDSTLRTTEVGAPDVLERLLADVAKPYRATTRFKPDDAINHPKFGLGRVVATDQLHKMRVTFGNGPRTLVHASASSR